MATNRIPSRSNNARRYKRQNPDSARQLRRVLFQAARAAHRRWLDETEARTSDDYSDVAQFIQERQKRGPQ